MEKKQLVIFSLLLFIFIIFSFYFFSEKKIKKVIPKEKKIEKKVKKKRYKPILNVEIEKVLPREEKKGKEEEKENVGLEKIKMEKLTLEEKEKIDNEIKKKSKKFHLQPTLKELEELKKKRIILY